MDATMTGTIFDSFLEELKTTSNDWLEILEQALEPKKETDIVLLDKVPDEIKKIVALSAAYRKRAAEAKIRISFDPKSDKDACLAEIAMCEAKENLLNMAWWASIKDAANAWDADHTVQIRVGWMVVEDPTCCDETLDKAARGLARLVAHAIVGRSKE